jgi:hypothetical protein
LAFEWPEWDHLWGNSDPSHPSKEVTMQALELEATVVDHAITVQSDRLPAYPVRVRVIILYEEPALSPSTPLAEFLAHPFKTASFQPLSREEANVR